MHYICAKSPAPQKEEEEKGGEGTRKNKQKIEEKDSAIQVWKKPEFEAHIFTNFTQNPK